MRPLLDPADPGLRPLSEMEGFEVAEGDPDLRGVEVRDEESAPIGRVADLLVDPEAEVVRALLVETPGLGCIRVPVERVDVLPEERVIRVATSGPTPDRPGLVIGPASIPRPAGARVRRRIEQPIARGPAVQGTGEATQERRESAEAGRGGARTVEGAGAEGPDRWAERSLPDDSRGSAPRR